MAMKKFSLLLFLFLNQAHALELNCKLSHWSFSNGTTEIKSWSAPVINDSVYYYADLNEYYVENGEEYRVSSRYSLANGFFYAELYNRKTDNGSYSESYQAVEKPNIATRYQNLELRCYFNKSQER